jgi:hypothetical protein
MYTSTSLNPIVAVTLYEKKGWAGRGVLTVKWNRPLHRDDDPRNPSFGQKSTIFDILPSGLSTTGKI